VAKDGRPQYRIEMRERALDDFVPACWWQQTSPRSHFTRPVICSRLTQDGRISLSGRELIRAAGRQRTEEDLPDDQAVLAAYRDHFGTSLSNAPEPRGPASPVRRRACR
jgi:N-hydroxyarylamine O-acetyltransferase